MALTLWYHPLSSYCMKVLIALYENDTPFTYRFVDLRQAEERAALTALWPLSKLPVLTDDAEVVPESSIIIEYLDRKYPGRAKLIPADPDAAHRVRLKDRFFDLHVMEQMFKIVTDRLRPADKRDPFGVEQARDKLSTALGMVDEATGWAAGNSFSMADCTAGPALFYANKVLPFEASHANAAAYLDRLMKRPSFARALKEAEPYMELFPQ